MLLELIGPLAILYHSRFSWGALNSAAALGAMIVVASSGLIGRFFLFARPPGLFGPQAGTALAARGNEELLAHLAQHGVAGDAILCELQSFEDRAVAAGRSFWTSARAVAAAGIASRRAHGRFRALPSGGGWRGQRSGPAWRLLPGGTAGRGICLL